MTKAQILIERLDNGHSWKPLTDADKRVVTDYYLSKFSETHRKLSIADAREQTPDWWPTNASSILRLYNAPTWYALMHRFGMSAQQYAPRRQQKRTTRCECGQQATRNEPITILGPTGIERESHLLLCDDCYVEFLEIEAARERR